MNKIIYLFFSILFTGLLWSQEANYTVNPTSSVEVGINTPFSFSFRPVTDIPAPPEGQPVASVYRISAWFISSAYSNMNNSGTNYYNTNAQALVNVPINQNQTLNFPIKWEDNNNQLSDGINISTHVEFYNSDGNFVGSRIYTHTVTVNVNRIFTPNISTPTILGCCNAAVTFTASNYGTANVFNWSVSGGTFSGSGSSISVTPLPGNGVVTASCTVSRSAGLNNYTRSNSRTVSRTARTATFTALYPDFPNNSQPFDFICKGGSGRQFTVPEQCGLSSVEWFAPNCTITGQGTTTATITPLNTVTTGSTNNIYAIVSFQGGCTATTSSGAFKILDGSSSPTPAGYFTVTPNNGDICTAEFFELTFNSTNSFNNGITTVSPPFIWGPGDPHHYRLNKPTKVTVCNKNLCTGQSVCTTFTVYPPAPCGDFNRSSMIQDTEITLSPNPTNGLVHVSLPEPLSGNYQVFDPTNSVLVQEDVFDNQTELQIELSQKLQSGMYILKVNTENASYTEKIILTE